MSKIKYGIDLGTTNSSIAKIERGNQIIIKSETLKDTMPSCVSFTKNKILVGDKAYANLDKDNRYAFKDKNYQSNTFIEFKRTMGTDKKYKSTILNKEYLSEELSAEVLKTLKSFVAEEDIDAIVITVPAKFTINQKDATVRAAKLSGFKQIELLIEPIAASMAYGLDTKKKNGIWLVYDFGGGTFDVALIKAEDGIMKIFDTEGDNYLGGKNIDYAIIDEILLPYFKKNYTIDKILEDNIEKEKFRNCWKAKAEEAKIQLSFKESYIIETELGDDYGKDDNGESFELNLEITREELNLIISPIFQKSISLTKDLLKRNNLEGKNLETIILVGGPTYTPILREMLKKQIFENIDISVDPMTIVTKGAALFASTIDNKVIPPPSKDVLQLELIYESTTVENEEFLTIKILNEYFNEEMSNKYYTEIIRGDGAWNSGKVQIDSSGEVIEVKLEPEKANVFDIHIYNEQGDKIPNAPNEIVIIQGAKPGSSILNYHIGIEIKSESSNKYIFKPIKGLEKNQSLPAYGVENELKTLKQINPGQKKDVIKIPIYEGEHGSEGSRAIHQEHIYNFLITGEDLPSVLPEGSKLEFKINVDTSGQITASAYFPYMDYTKEIVVPRDNSMQKEISSEVLETEISKAIQSLNIIKQDGKYIDEKELDKLSNDINDLDKLFQQGKNDYDRKKQVLDNLRRNLIKIDTVQEKTEWPKIEEELKESFYKLEDAFREFKGKLKELNEDRIVEAISQFKEQIPIIIKDKNSKAANELSNHIKDLIFAIVDIGLGATFEISLLHQFNEEFDIHDWKDKNKARILINQGLQIASRNPSKDKLRPILIELYKLLPQTGTDGGIKCPNCDMPISECKCYVKG